MPQEAAGTRHRAARSGSAIAGGRREKRRDAPARRGLFPGKEKRALAFGRGEAGEDDVVLDEVGTVDEIDVVDRVVAGAAGLVAGEGFHRVHADPPGERGDLGGAVAEVAQRDLVAEIAVGGLHLLDAGLGHVFRIFGRALRRHLAGPAAEDDFIGHGRAPLAGAYGGMERGGVSIGGEYPEHATAIHRLERNRIANCPNASFDLRGQLILLGACCSAMTITLETLCREISTEKTAILFGAGSSLPSGAPTGQELADRLSELFNIKAPGMNLIEVATLVEIKNGRGELVHALRKILRPLKPTGGILNLPNYKWRDIFTTNFDQIIEKAFAKAGCPLSVISANYEFDKSYDDTQKLFKLHGTIEKDISDADLSRIIISQEDYTVSSDYRQNLYDRFMLITASSDLLVVGYSLSDPDLMSIVDEAVKRKRTSGSPGRIYILSYTADENRALLLEQKGLRVAFGGLDEFIAALDKFSSGAASTTVSTEDVLSFFPHLRPNSIDVSHALGLENSDANRMFYGSPPNYADIVRELTFERDAISLLRNYFVVDGALLVYVLGVAGVGKTTLCRQMMANASRSGDMSWEHVDGTELKASLWASVARKLKADEKVGYLYIDNAHKYMREINELVDELSRSEFRNLRVIISSSVEQWNYRAKTANVFLHGRQVTIKRLSRTEVQKLLDLFDSRPEISRLVEKEFAGFSRSEKQRRLEQRCASDFFVCLKNIFSTELLDDIVLREFAGLRPRYQDLYRVLSAFEASGVKLHRQMAIRALSLPAEEISTILEDLDGLVAETTVNEGLGIYAWSGRHIVISEIIMRSKFSEESEIASLYELFVDLVNPTFDIERLNLMELCGKRGIGRLANRDRQNHLYAKIISKAPTLRVPRHRLINNLIRLGRYERAANEIRIFESDLRADAPLWRYKIDLSLERARHSSGLMAEDRLAIVRESANLARRAVERFEDDISLYEAFCDAGVQYMRLSGDWAVADEALKAFKDRSQEAVDPEFARAYARYQFKVQQIQGGGRALAS